MAVPLLQTKLYVPPTRSEWVSRPRLIERLNAGLSRKLTLVSAPAGFGKTTLLSEWVHCRGAVLAPAGGITADGPSVPPQPLQAAWLSLDEDDNDLTRFLAYVIAALRILPDLSETDLGADAMAMLQSHQPPPTNVVLTSLINDLVARPAASPLALVLDDYHLIKGDATAGDAMASQAIHDALVFVLDHLPPPTDEARGSIHLVIAARADPPLPLARLRVNGEMNELRAGDLRFTAGEMRDYFNQAMELGLDSDEIAALDGRTEGWIAGLHLAALSLRARPDRGERAAFIEAFAGDDRHVMDYLVNQVLARQPEPVQRFLLKTAILERLSGPLCDAVLDQEGGDQDSQAVLEYLEQANLFVVPLDNRRGWYRYHHMFADLLRFRLHREVGAQGLAPLQIRASEWYEQNGYLVEAIHQALAAQDHERALHLVEGSVQQMFVRSELATILRWVDALPADLVRARPWLCVYTAWSKRLSGAPVPEVAEWVHAAEQALADAETVSVPPFSREEARAMRGHIAALRAYQALYREQIPRALELARQALRDLPREDFIRGLSALALGWATRFSGDLVGAGRAFREATEASLASGNRYVASASAARLAYTHVLEGRLHRAETRCHEALDLARGAEGRRLPVAGYALVYLGGVHYEWNQLESAAHHLLQGIEMCAQVGFLMDQIVGFATLARVRQAQGDEAGAREACRTAEDLSDKMRGYLYARRWVQNCQVRLWIAQGQLDAVAHWVEDTNLGVDDEVNFTRELAHLILARALVALGRQAPKGGHLADGLQLLARLLNAAEAAGWMGKAIEMLALQALAHQAQGDTVQALAALQRALALAEPEGYARVFLDEGAPMTELLQQAAGRGIATEYVRKLLGSSTDEGRKTKDEPPSVLRRSSFVEPLSDRELEVLTLLSDGLTNQEIASRLYLAVSTVKVHTRNLYSKLDVHSRVQAVARAHELGLLEVRAK